MARSIGSPQIQKYQKRIASLQSSTAKAREKAGEVVENALRTFEVGGSAFAFGLISGRTGGYDVFGVPLDLGVGVGAHVFALLGVGGKAESHMRALGDGALASYLTTVGRGVGRTMAAQVSGVSGEDGARTLPAHMANTAPAAYAEGEYLAPEELMADILTD